MSTKKEFGFIRNVIFPIHKEELRKFLPLASLFVLISFNYALTRSLKDMSLLKEASTAALYFLKLFGITPSMIIFTILYSKVSAVTNRDGRFNAVMIYFLVFFLLSLLFLLPYQDALKLNGFAEMMTRRFPRFVGLWEVIAFWPVSLFYIHAEAWGTFALGVSFWTFANEITGIEQAKRFYGLLSLFAALGSILAGSMLKLESIRSNFSHGLAFVVVAIVVILVLYNSFSKDIKAHPEYYNIVEKPKKKKVRLSFMESLNFLFKSKYLMLISLLVISYGLMISLFEAVYKSQVKTYVSVMNNPALYADIYSQQQVLSGIFQILMALFVAAPVLRRGWKFAASVTPITALVMSSMFFIFLYLDKFFDPIFQSFNVTAIYMAVQVGLYNVVFIKAAKYILFDSTKEAAYIPLDQESKVRGKAAVDGIGSRLGKSLGGFLVTFLTATIGNGDISNIRTSLSCLIFLVIIVWLIAINKLSVLKAVAEEKYEADLKVDKG